MHCSTIDHQAAARNRARRVLLASALIAAFLASPGGELAAQGRIIAEFPYTQAFAFIASGSSTTPSGPIGASIFPTTDVDGGELTADSGTSALMVSGSATGLNNNLGAGGMIRIQTSGSALPTIAQGFIVHASFTGHVAGSIAIDWTKVANGTSPRGNQLRIAVSADGGAFTDIASASFDNSSTPQSGTLSTTLPTSLDGATSVRFRISSINVSGSGAHPRVIVDNLRIDASEETPLPVELVSFGARYHDGVVGLEWRTAAEHDNEGFEVLRASADDSVFVPVASWRTHESLRGLGTSPSGRAYHFDDALPASILAAGGTLLYRLADVAPDGSRSEHPIRAVRIEVSDESAMTAAPLVHFRLDPPYPMPAGDKLVARVSVARDARVTLEVVAANGERHLRVDAPRLTAGAHEYTIDVGELPSGTYTLVARTDEGVVRTRQFIIVR